MSEFNWIVIAILLVYLFFAGRKSDKEDVKRSTIKKNFIAKYALKAGGAIYRELHKHGFSLIYMSKGDYEISNVYHTESADMTIYMFDFIYTPESDGSTSLEQPMIPAVFISQNNNTLFHFEVSPETLWKKTKQLFGSNDINFGQHPTFSKKYQLIGNDENIIRQRFSSAIIEAIEEQNGLCIEGRQGCLLCYYPTLGRQTDHELLYTKALAVYNLLR